VVTGDDRSSLLHAPRRRFGGGLRALLAEAFLIDPPDQAERVQALETDRDAARAATASGDLDGYPSRNFDALCINPTVLF
jgi:hypothetical protein